MYSCYRKIGSMSWVMSFVTFKYNSAFKLLLFLGGWGARKLHMVSPEDSGCTGLILKTASGSGKGVLYIAPIQEKLDILPLPPDSRSFSTMPKAVCHSCHTSYPLQILSLHVQTCKPSDTYPQEVCIDPIVCWEITLYYKYLLTCKTQKWLLHVFMLATRYLLWTMFCSSRSSSGATLLMLLAWKYSLHTL